MTISLPTDATTTTDTPQHAWDPLNEVLCNPQFEISDAIQEGMRMSRTRKNAVRIVGPDVNLEDEVILDSKGRRVDQAYIELAMQEVEEELAKRAGRPSLTGTSAHSPHVSFRIPPELKARAEQAARERGTTVSKLAREAFERFLAS